MAHEQFDHVFETMMQQVERDVNSNIVTMDVMGEKEDRLFVRLVLANGREMDITIHAFKLFNGDMGLRFFGNYIS